MEHGGRKLAAEIDLEKILGRLPRLREDSLKVIDCYDGSVLCGGAFLRKEEGKDSEGSAETFHSPTFTKLAGIADSKKISILESATGAGDAYRLITCSLASRKMIPQHDPKIVP